MSTTPGALNRAILARIRGTETPALTGEWLTAQAALLALVPKWRWGTMTKAGVMPSGNFYDDAPVSGGLDRAPDVGIVQQSIRRFEIWGADTDDTLFNNAANYLEMLFDSRRGAPDLPVDGDGVCYDTSLFVGFQGPFFDTEIDAYYGLISFRFVEARP